MLSPHEIATLMLVRDAPQFELDCAELEALLERQLVAFEKLASGERCFYLTHDGDAVLHAFTRSR